jgi:hypothetical protein
LGSYCPEELKLKHEFHSPHHDTEDDRNEKSRGLLPEFALMEISEVELGMLVDQVVPSEQDTAISFGDDNVMWEDSSVRDQVIVRAHRYSREGLAYLVERNGNSQWMDSKAVSRGAIFTYWSDENATIGEELVKEIKIRNTPASGTGRLKNGEVYYAFDKDGEIVLFSKGEVAEIPQQIIDLYQNYCDNEPDDF